MKYIVLLLITIIAFYTVLYGFDVFKEKNYSGFFGSILLALATIGLPFYLLFLKG